MAVSGIDLGKYKLGWSDSTEDYVYAPKKGLNEEVVRDISGHKSEPEWMTKFRLNALKRFERKPMLEWFAKNMPDIDFDDIYYYLKPTSGQVSDWDMLPEEMKNTYEKLGIPEAERKFLAGVTAQYECLRGSTRVWTTQGMRAIKELEPGDEVFSLDEAAREVVRSRVVGAACSGDKEVFEIRARGAVIGASGNHPFLALRDERKPGRQRSTICAPVTTWPSRPTSPSTERSRRCSSRTGPKPRATRASPRRISAGGPASTSATASSSAGSIRWCRSRSTPPTRRSSPRSSG
jgi:hypothetical protein